MKEDLFKRQIIENQSEKTDAELLTEKEELWKVISECPQCQIGLGSCHTHKIITERFTKIQEILNFRNELHQMCDLGF